MLGKIFDESYKVASDMDLPNYRLFDCECMHIASKVAVFGFTFFTSTAYWAYLEITK